MLVLRQEDFVNGLTEVQAMERIVQEYMPAITEFANGELYPESNKLIIPIPVDDGTGCMEVWRSGAEKIVAGKVPQYENWQVK